MCGWTWKTLVGEFGGLCNEVIDGLPRHRAAFAEEEVR